MADGIEFKIEGFDKALDRLSQFSPKLQKKGLRAALRKGANLVKAAAVSNARAIDDPATPENIAKNIAVQISARQSRQVGGLVMRVGVRGGARQYANTKVNRRKGRVGASYSTGGDKGNPGGDTWYWRFIEFGTSARAARPSRFRRRSLMSRMTKGRRAHAGVKPRPFLRPALENNIEAATAAVAAELDRQIDQLAGEL